MRDPPPRSKSRLSLSSELLQSRHSSAESLDLPLTVMAHTYRCQPFLILKLVLVSLSSV